MRTSDVRALALSDKVVLGHLLKASEDTTEEEEEEEVTAEADDCTKCPNKDRKTKQTVHMTGDQYIM